jgi:Ring finger domain
MVFCPQTFGANDSRSTSSEHSDAPPQKAAVTVAISKPFEDSGDTATDIEDLSMDGCLDDVSLNDDDNPKTLPCCAICLEPFRCGDQVSYSHDPLCSHEYHTTCIVEWLLKHMNCPYCRRGYIPIPPSVKKASMVVAPSQQHVASGWDYVANAESSSTSTILPSPTAEPIDIEMGEGATSSAEALPRNSIPEDDERISI